MRRGPEELTPGQLWIGLCEVCGKRTFASRRAAKKAARFWFPGEALRAYQCGEHWHIGHTPAWVKHGEKE